MLLPAGPKNPISCCHHTPWTPYAVDKPYEVRSMHISAIFFFSVKRNLMACMANYYSIIFEGIKIALERSVPV